MTAPLGHAQGVTAPKTLCAKCGVVTEIGKCPPGAKLTDQPCVDSKNFTAQKPSVTLPMAPLGDTKTATPPNTLCAKCGVVTEIGKCPPDAKLTDWPCVDPKNFTAKKAPVMLPKHAEAESAQADSRGETLACAKCGKPFLVDEGIKELANQP